MSEPKQKEEDVTSGIKASLVAKELSVRMKLLAQAKPESLNRHYTRIMVALSTLCLLGLGVVFVFPSWRFSFNPLGLAAILSLSFLSGLIMQTNKRVNALIELIGEDALLKGFEQK